MYNKLIITIIVVNLENEMASSVKSKIECGYKQCPPTREGALNVHLIPHSHMDAGWVKTFDEYYHGTKTMVSTANVQLIYHSVLSELLHDRRRKFTFSETAYFWRWWKEQRPATRSTFRTLVQEGRIEFAGGGWVQNDEATLDYVQIIDQFTWGLRKLNDTLGPCGKPKAAWQIDTYGHTREQASLLAQMGYDGLFIGRVDHKQREAMIEEDRMEFMWRGSDVLGKMSDIMSHTLFNLYNAPDGFCFDFLCSDEPIVDDPDSLVYNAEKRVAEFISQVERQAKYYDHDNILVTMGGDFTYQSAGNWFMNMDKLINHVNTHRANISDVNIFYSTPSCYLKAIYLYGRRDKAIYTERGDHVPYSSDAGTYWTGYYTSRPSLKYFARRAHTFLQVVKQLTVIARMGDSFELHLLRHAANLVLHHDAITGTSQQHVTNDFIRILSEAIDACTKKVSTLLSYLTPTWGGSRRSKSNQQFTVCHQLNMTQCKFTESPEAMLLLVYNPSSVKTYHHVRIPAMVLHYTIRDYNDEEVEYQLMPLPAAVINLPGRSSTAIQELCFEAENIPPLGYTAYYISPVRDQLEENEFAKKVKQSNRVVEPDQEITPNISNEYLKVAVNKETGLLESIQHVDGVKLELSQNFHYYSQTQQAFQSGAYSFRPDRNRPVPVTEKVSYNTIRGNIVKEIRQRFTDWITQTIRLYRGEEFVELEWIIGPVPIGADLGKEVVSLFKTNVTNSGQFHMDSNGRQMVQRTCWNETAGDYQKRPVSSCYYPVTSRLCVLSTNASTPVGVCVLTDRTQGGTAYEEGEIELMVHRRLLTDDGFGLEESLNEEAFGVGLVVKGRHRIYFGNFKQDIDDLTFSERMAHASRRWQMEPWLFFTPGEKVTRRKWQNIRTKRYTALKVHGLPRNVQVLTLEPWKSGSVLLRLENTLDRNGKGSVKSENPDVPSSPSHATVRLRQLFLQLRIRRVRETTLGANQWLDDARQMDWSTRYVYSGADDDILPEDQALFTDDSKADKELAKDAAPYSDEEPAYARRKAPRKRIDQKPNRPKTKTVYEEAERKKRYANENVMDNVINGTFNDKFNEQVNQTNEGTDKSIQYQTIKADFINETSSKSEDLFKLLKYVTKDPQGVRKTEQRYSNSKGNVWSKPTKFFVDFDNDSEEITSEEDFTSNSSKKVKSKKKARPDPITTDSDDGITKSIYEMYYKTKPRQMPFRPLIRSSEEVTEEPQAGRRYRNKKPERILAIDYRSTEGTRDTEESRSIEDVRKRFRKRKNKGKILKVDMPFFLTSEGRDFGMKKRGYEESGRGYVEESGEMRTKLEEKGSEIDALPMKERKAKRIDEHEVESPFDVDDEKETERYDEPASESRMENRRKRASRLDEMDAPTSEQTPDEPDYVVTLRPTQIRTFVIWFENNKKPYAV